MDQILDIRKSPRVDIKLPVQFKEINKGSIEHRGKSSSLNISHEGICIHIDKFISISHRLDLEINLPFQDNPVEILVRIIWEHMTQEGMLIGAKFLGMKKETIYLVDEMIETEMFATVLSH